MSSTTWLTIRQSVVVASLDPWLSRPLLLASLETLVPTRCALRLGHGRGSSLSRNPGDLGRDAGDVAGWPRRLWRRDRAASQAVIANLVFQLRPSRWQSLAALVAGDAFGPLGPADPAKAPLTISYASRARWPDPAIVATILEAGHQRGHSPPKCGGQGRCSVPCRGRRGPVDLPAASEEARVLSRESALARWPQLACRTSSHHRRCRGRAASAPSRRTQDMGRQSDYLQGDEQEVAILFADLRFTTLSEDKLPYDVVFLLNRYFAAMGTAIEEAGGRIDEFIGDEIAGALRCRARVKQGCGSALDAAAWPSVWSS